MSAESVYDIRDSAYGIIARITNAIACLRRRRNMGQLRDIQSPRSRSRKKSSQPKQTTQRKNIRRNTTQVGRISSAHAPGNSHRQIKTLDVLKELSGDARRTPGAAVNLSLVGKTAVLREMVRLLSDKFQQCIVVLDTTSEL